MRKIKRLVAAAAVTVMAFSIAGCNMIEKTPEAIAKTVLAKVGNETITMADVNSELQADIDYLIETYGEDYESKIDDSMKTTLKSAREDVLGQLVEEKVILTKGAELGYIPSDEELAEDIAAEREKFVEAYGSEEKLAEALEYYGLTEEKFELFVTNIVKTAKVKEAVTADVTVTEEEAETYYNENIATYTTPAGANAKHILFDLEEEEAAKAAKEKIGSDKAIFDEVFAEYEANATSGTYPLSEDLGYVENEQSGFDTDFLEGFKVLKEGEISDLVKSQFGYHIIYVDGVQTEDVVTPFADVKETIMTSLETTNKNTKFTETLEQWKEDLKVKTYEDRL